MPLLAGATIVQVEPNTLSAVVDRGGPVKLSFFGVPALPVLAASEVADGVRIASLLDLARTKAAVVQVRAEAKDYLDIDALLGAGFKLDTMLRAGRELYGAGFAAMATLKALTFFDDGDLATVPHAVRARLGRCHGIRYERPRVTGLLDAARRIVWLPKLALAIPARFIAYAMRYATPADMALVREHFDDDALRAALDAMPPGIIDGRSWSYWNAVLGRFPAPPVPMRRLP